MNMAAKVVIATYDFPPSMGGVSTYTSLLAAAFFEHDYDTTVVTTCPGPEEGFKYRVVRSPGALKLSSLYISADILIMSNLAISLIYPLLLLRRRFALCHHSESAFRLRDSILSLDYLRRLVMSRADHFVTSEFIGRKGGLRSFTVAHPFLESYNALKMTEFPVGDRANAVFVGRLEPEKGVFWLIERLPIIREMLGIDTVYIIGDGTLKARVTLEAGAPGSGLVYLGPLPREVAVKQMAGARYVFVPSLWDEPFGIVALEAIASGAITIAAKRGGLPEAIGSVGISYDPDDATSFRGAMTEACFAFESHLLSKVAHAKYLSEVGEHLQKFGPDKAVDLFSQTFLGKPSWP